MSTLYFIRARDLVKIGITDDTRRRLLQLQTGNPAKLEIVATIPDATLAVEKIYHATLKRWRVRGEWFAGGPLQKLLQNIQGGAQPRDEAAIRHYLELEYRGPKREKTPPPAGFGPVIAEVRAVFNANPEGWIHAREAFIAKNGHYLQAVGVIDRKFNCKYRANVRRSP